MSKQKRNPKSRVSRHFEIPMIAIHNNIVFSRTEAWAYYKLDTIDYDALGVNARVEAVNSLSVALASLVSNNTKKVDCHLLITNMPFDIGSWVEQMQETYQRWNGNDDNKEFYNFLYEQTKMLQNENYQKRVVYLGVKLFTRGSFSLDNFNILEFGVKEAFEVLKKSFERMLYFSSEEISENELAKAKRDESHISRILATGKLKGVATTSEELLLATKRILHPYMPSPYLEVEHDTRINQNDIAMETGGIIEDNYRYLRILQFINEVEYEGLNEGEYEGFRATLSFSKFPQASMGEPSLIPPFLYYLEERSKGIPFSANARFSLVPHKEVKKKLDDKKLENDDELKNFAQSGQRTNSTIINNIQDIELLESELDEAKLPWVSGNYRITVEAQSVEQLTTLITELKQEYADFEIILTWTAGDQMALLYEELPGGSLKINSFNQMTNLAMLSTSGFNYGGEVGDVVKQKFVSTRRRRRR